MSRESKIALLVGLGFIITYGVILSEARNDKVPGENGNVTVAIDRTSVSRSPRPLTVTIPQVHRGGRTDAQVGSVRLKAEEMSRQRQQMAAEPAPQRKRVYVVQSGDNLTKIAKKIYGPQASGRYLDIFNANTDKLADPDSLKVGMKLVIPQ